MRCSKPSESYIKNDIPKTNLNNALFYDTPKISDHDKYLPKNESSATNSSAINRRGVTVGLKKPPAYSINLKNLTSDKNQKVSPDEDTESDAGREEFKLSNKIKKEYLAPRSNIFESSEGNNIPSEHDVMAEKARLGKISENEFMDYVSKVDCAPLGSNLAGMNLDSDPSDQSSSDIEI
ncbi:hypothetical protein AYI69_g11352 [Smittium culicis]|uniref:Uncharacterized protein n=1 Tax=Smittium culicis TaxID=133412 RepID=A0A1R1WZC5_9FUNG|nr:hypothetical protein AYI69_g11352 [Smittium culicis]